MARILLIATGGTIAMRKDPAGKVVPADRGVDLLKALPELAQDAQWDVLDFSNVASCNMTPERMLALARVVKERLANPCLRGVVITHGTDTLEETAFFLDVTIGDRRPVIMTASQRDASETDCDGPRNLYHAMLIALDRQALQRGVVIVLNEEIHAARDVRKLHTSNVEAFDSGEIGVLGQIDNGEVVWRRRPEPTVLLGLPDRLANVPICKVFTGISAGFFRSVARQQIEGLVLEAFGRGNVPPEIVPEIRKLVDKGVPVVITSRCLFGRTAPVYGYPGGGADLERAGAWFASDLATEKVRLFLSTALAQNVSLNVIRRHLAYGGVRH